MNSPCDSASYAHASQGAGNSGSFWTDTPKKSMPWLESAQQKFVGSKSSQIHFILCVGDTVVICKDWHTV